MGDPATYQHPLIPEDVLADKTGLEMLLEETSLALDNSPAAAEMEDTKTAEKTFEGKLEESIERVVPDDVMAVTDVGTEVGLEQYFSSSCRSYFSWVSPYCGTV